MYNLKITRKVFTKIISEILFYKRLKRIYISPIFKKSTALLSRKIRMTSCQTKFPALVKPRKK